MPWNAWLHDGERPHLELVPRLAIQAGVELGAGIAVNTVAPGGRRCSASRRLRPD